MKTSFSDLAPVVPMLRQHGQKVLLHVGCGTATRSRLPQCFQSEDWREIRLDIDETVKPDIVASITDLSGVKSGSVHAIWSSHNLEHLQGFETKDVLKEFVRVLTPGGFLLATFPDLKSIAQLIVDDKLDTLAYMSPAGPITALDMLFGHQASLEAGKKYMAHRTGFTSKSIQKQLAIAGFETVRVMNGSAFDIWALAVKAN